MSRRLALVGCGAMTPVGLSAPSTCAAVRAHISAFSQSNLYHESFRDVPVASFARRPPILHRITEARIPNVTDDRPTDLFTKLVGFAEHAIDECLQRSDNPTARAALILGVRERYREHPDLNGREREWIRGVEAKLGTRFHPSSAAIPAGHTSVFQGLETARELLTNGDVDLCVVAGIDSYLNVYDLQRLVEAYRVLGPSTNGLVPGEGAACVSVRLARTAEPAPVSVFGVGLDAENSEAIELSDGHPTGRGLQYALERAMIDANLPESIIDLRVSDLNGETYRTDESLLAATRFYKTYRPHLEIWHPAECVGDIGAASGALSIILGWAGLTGGYAPGAIAMCESSSDTGQRAGCVIGLSSVADVAHDTLNRR